jgi:hypothetical protein
VRFVSRIGDRHSHHLRANELPEERKVRETDQVVEVDVAYREQEEADGSRLGALLIAWSLTFLLSR